MHIATKKLKRIVYTIMDWIVRHNGAWPVVLVDVAVVCILTKVIFKKKLYVLKKFVIETTCWDSRITAVIHDTTQRLTQDIARDKTPTFEDEGLYKYDYHG